MIRRLLFYLFIFSFMAIYAQNRDDDYVIKSKRRIIILYKNNIPVDSLYLGFKQDNFKKLDENEALKVVGNYVFMIVIMYTADLRILYKIKRYKIDKNKGKFISDKKIIMDVTGCSKAFKIRFTKKGIKWKRKCKEKKFSGFIYYSYFDEIVDEFKKYVFPTGMCKKREISPWL